MLQFPAGHGPANGGRFVMPDEVVFEVHEAEEGGYYAAAVGYDIITQGDSWEELKLMAQDAVLCHFDDGATPGTFRLHLVKDEVVAV
jgi:predicted RNase H-like HicB family nuclease